MSALFRGGFNSETWLDLQLPKKAVRQSLKLQKNMQFHTTLLYIYGHGIVFN